MLDFTLNHRIALFCVKLEDECSLFISQKFHHLLFHICRTLGQYRHQTLSASWC